MTQKPSTKSLEMEPGMSAPGVPPLPGAHSVVPVADRPIVGFGGPPTFWIFLLWSTVAWPERQGEPRGAGRRWPDRAGGGGHGELGPARGGLVRHRVGRRHHRGRLRVAPPGGRPAARRGCAAGADHLGAARVGSARRRCPSRRAVAVAAVPADRHGLSRLGAGRWPLRAGHVPRGAIGPDRRRAEHVVVRPRTGCGARPGRLVARPNTRHAERDGRARARLRRAAGGCRRDLR